MNLGKEFKQYAVKHKGISSATLHNYEAHFNPVGLTPYIIEERTLNVAQMDVFSRLMMDRIIFLGQAIDDYVANIITRAIAFFGKYRQNKGHPNVHQQPRWKCVCGPRYL